MMKIPDIFTTANKNQIDIAPELADPELLCMGVHEVAYIRFTDVDGTNVYVIHAADGTPLSAMDSWDDASFVIEDNDMSVVKLH